MFFHLSKLFMFEEQFFFGYFEISLKTLIVPPFLIVISGWAERCVEATLQCEKPSY